MTTEQKAKAYEEALKKIQPLYEQAKKDDNPIWSTYEHLFPELRESEDERIIEEIKFAVMQMPSERQDTKNRCLAWLEKQKEHHIPWYDYQKSKDAGYTIVPNKEYEQLIKQKEQKPIKVYRVENEDKQKGLWRKFDGTWEPLFDMLTDGLCRDLPMEDSDLYRADGKQWFASAPSRETLQKWFSKRDLEELTAAGFTISEFEVTNYKKVSEFEYIFTRDSIINRAYLTVSDIYPEQKPVVSLDTMLSKDPHLPKQAVKYEQKPEEKQDYSGLIDLERAIHRGFLSAGVENVPVTIIKETAQECLAEMKPAEQDYDNKIQYDSVKSGIEAFASTYSFNIESKLFPQLTKAQQQLWREEIEQAVIAGGEDGAELARDNRYKENRMVEWSEDDKKMLLSIINAFRNGTVSTIGQKQWLKSLPERFNLQPMQKDNKCISPKEGDIVVNKYGEISVFENWGHHPDGGSFNDDSYFFAKCTLAGDYYDDFDCHPESEGLRYATPEEIRKIVPYLLKEKIWNG
jgi:hypothetical protein